MAVKLIALDLDGTLLGEDHSTVPERNLKALREASARGVKIAIASGRCWSLVEELAESMGMVDYAILANGACVRDVKEGKWLFRIGIENRQTRTIVHILREKGLRFEVYQNGESYLENFEAIREELGGKELSDLARVALSSVVPVEDVIEALGEDVSEKFNIFRVDPRIRGEIVAAVTAVGPVACTNATENNLEISPIGADKGTAVKRLSELLGISSEEVMAFGDADNDLGMLTWAGWSFAMGNAFPAVKRAARYQTGSNREAGVGQAVERFVLGRE